MIPARLVVECYVRPGYAYPDGHEDKIASLPGDVIDGAKYERSASARIATANYAEHLSLHRLEGVFKRYCAQLSKQSMWDMLVRVDELVAQPVLAAFEVTAETADQERGGRRDGTAMRTGALWGGIPDDPLSRELRHGVEFKPRRGRPPAARRKRR